MKYNILVVDDEVDNLKLLVRTFRNKYNIFAAESGPKGIEILKDKKIDLIIADYKMPEMDGIEFLKQAYDYAPDTIRILVTAYTDLNILIEAINTGKIYRYLKKPWLPDEILTVVQSALEVYQLNIENQELVSDFKELFSGTITAITEALDAKDSFTYGRSKRVTFYAVEIARQFGLSDVDLGRVELAGLLHDIGMIGVPENVLNKPGNLTPDEFDDIRKHVVLSVKILEEIKQLHSVLDIIKFHHERFDGNGYPNGLKGEEIPICARIISVADAYDSMVSDRPYRKGLTHEKAVEEIKRGTGSQFDPYIVDAFLSIVEEARTRVLKS